MKLGIDIDGCLANFNIPFGREMIETTGVNRFHPEWEAGVAAGVYPTTWNWHTAAGYTADQSRKVWSERVEGTKDFWRNLPPLDGAAATLKQLNRLAKGGAEVYFLTHRSGKRAKQQTEEWLQQYGMELPTVLLTGNKVPVIDSLRLDFFVDDKLETTAEVYYHFNNSGPKVYLKDAPWNRENRPVGLVVVESVEAALRDVELWSEVKRGRPRKVTFD